MSQEIQFAGPCLEQSIIGGYTTISKVRFSPCGARLAGGTLDASVVVWYTENLSRYIGNNAHTGSVHSVCWSPNSTLVASAGTDRNIGIWQPEANGSSIIFEGHRKCIRSVDFDPTGTLLLSASNDKTLKIWSVNDSQCLFAVVGHSDWVRDGKFSPNGGLIASCGDDKMLRVCDVNSGVCVRAIKDDIGMGRKVAWHPGGRAVAVALTSNRVKVKAFDIVQGIYSQDYEVHSAPLSDVDFHPSGTYLLTSADDGTARIIDLVIQRPTYTLTGHKHNVTSGNFSPDGKRFATAGTDRKLILWKSNMLGLDARTFYRDQWSVQQLCTPTYDPNFLTYNEKLTFME